jgi:chemotaxis protein methyltransferase CheR
MSAASAITIEGSSGFDSLSKRNFARLANYIYEYSGIRMPPSKATMLEGRLRRRLRVTGHSSLEDYCRYLFEEGGLEQESVHLIDAVTTNKTDFFREPQHFDFMCQVAMPQFLERGKRTLRVWSAASSIGAEPYTIAMLLEEFRESEGIEYGVLATDLSTDVLAVGHKGIYEESMLEPVPERLMRKYVLRSNDRQQRKVRIHPKLRTRVAWGRLNLMGETYPVGNDMDMIFCRNVLIYFDKETQGRVLRRLAACLAPGGYLFVGHSETVSGFKLPLKQVAGTILLKE